MAAAPTKLEMRGAGGPCVVGAGVTEVAQVDGVTWVTGAGAGAGVVGTTVDS